jgi:Mg-chelatase subunit ChlD
MAGENTQFRRSDSQDLDFFEYWDSLGFFEYSRSILPPEFFTLFEIARVIFSDERLDDALSAIEQISKEERDYKPDRKESIQVNRLEKIAPLSDRMEIDRYRNIIDLKKALPRELAQEPEVFDIKLYTKTLLVQRHYETEADSFKPISTSRDKRGKEATRYEQKFFILLDRSKSMEAKMRTFYSKSIIAEFLRRKYNTKAKIFYRPFDSRPGDLMKVEKQQDFPRLIEEILLTTTGGRSTNIHEAILQAISDITYDKEMAKSEILMVTDGISKIEKNELRVKLGDIKLNVLKIGDDIAKPDLMEMESHLKSQNIDIYPGTMDIRTIKTKMDDYKQNGPAAGLSNAEKIAFRKIMDTSNKMFNDLKEVATKYIEIKDLNSNILYTLGPEQLDFIQFTMERFSIIDLKELTMLEKKKLFRQVQFFYQYIQMLMENGNAENKLLQEALETLVRIKRKMLKNPDLLYMFTEKKELTDDKETMKLAKAQAKQMLKQIKLDDRRLSVAEMKKAQLIFTSDAGTGSRGQFFMLLLVKLWVFLKKTFTRPGREATRAEKMKRAEDEERNRTGLDENEL